MTDEQSVSGWVPELASDEEKFAALEQAFDYRGDVAVTRTDGSVVEGYLFDRRTGDGLTDSHVRIMPADGSDVVTVGYDEVARLQFSDRDPAAGKSWETWVKKYVQKKLKGESASIYGEKYE
jgi:hypothetical protein